MLGIADSLVSVKGRNGHYIGGEWVEPITGEYFENISRATGSRSPKWVAALPEDIESALDAAHAAADAWGRASLANGRTCC